MVSQNDKILSALKRGKTVSALEALLEFGTMRLAARISDLRLAGYRIRTHIVKNGKKRYAVYSLTH